MLGLIFLVILGIIGLIIIAGIFTFSLLMLSIMIKLLFLPFSIALYILKSLFHLIFKLVTI